MCIDGTFPSFLFLYDLKQRSIEQSELDVRNRATVLELLASANKRSTVISDPSVDLAR